MRPDGEPERDDYPLPPIDVAVPDDARELERDLLAYRREQRRLRQIARRRRALRPFTRFGIALPLIIGAALIALISGTLLTVFGPRPGPRPGNDPVSISPGAPVAQPGRVGGLLPPGTIWLVNGPNRASLSTRSLHSGVIGIVTPDCACHDTVALLAKLTDRHGVSFRLVAGRGFGGESTQRTLRELRLLAGAAHDGHPPGILEDPAGLLAGAYGPQAGSAGPGLTAVLVHADGVVAKVIHQPQPSPAMEDKIESLRMASTRSPG